MATLPISSHKVSHRALSSLLAVSVTISLLSSHEVRTRLLSLVSVHQNEAAFEQRIITDNEKQELLQITAKPTAQPEATGEEAKQLNEKIPFSSVPVSAARPFHLPRVEATTEQTALKCLTQAIYYEAGFEPVTGRRAVAQVVLNRLRHPAFPKSVCGVVYQGSSAPGCQFSFTCDGSLQRAPQRAAWLAAESIARSALHGQVEPSVGASTHYHANYVAPYWAPRLVKLAQIGAHLFYRWPGSWGMPSAFHGRYQGVEIVPLISLSATKGALIDRQTEALAIARLPANLVPVRHAENDIGGRLDVTQGWTLNIPDPADSRKASAEALKRQTADGAAGTEKAAGNS